ncbi:MAG: PqqD family protein [Prolixibacteraceae bacterium]|jgi:hypothetical protein|nr:PqqD family protein [Bacteroidota bacterium]HOS91560.1 PqqD family protein [Prolixibacteraceae bacterium]HQJ86787.1 PqqD family protein [Prolixibacteraceae bacterium]
MIKFIRNSKTISGRLHDEMVMMDISLGKYFSLNSTATTIWELLEKPMTREEICFALMERYEVNPRQCAREVGEHLRKMTSIGLILTVEEEE